MDTDLLKWLDMVWSALDEQDPQKRVILLDNANSFLEQHREETTQPQPVIVEDKGARDRVSPLMAPTH
jgi:hypothetical protein